MGRGGQGHRGDEARQEGDANGYHRLRPRTHRGLQDAEDGRLHRGPAAQRLRQDPAPPSARSLLGRQGPPGELTARSDIAAASATRDQAHPERRPRESGDPYAVSLMLLNAPMALLNLRVPT